MCSSDLKDVAYDVAAADDGKIIVVGAKDGDAIVLRYNADGSLDDTFGDRRPAGAGVTQAGDAAAIVEDATRQVFEVSVEAIDLAAQIIDVLLDLGLVAVKVGGQPDLPAPVDERLGHPAEITVGCKSSITITQQAIHDTPGVSGADVQPAEARVGTAQHQNAR